MALLSMEMIEAIRGVVRRYHEREAARLARVDARPGDARASAAVPDVQSPTSVPAGWNPMRDAPRDGRQIIVLHTVHGVVEARFSPGSWSEDTPVSPAEYDGAVWVLGDDVEQVEVEEFGPDAPEPFHDGNVVGWLPRDALPAA